MKKYELTNDTITKPNGGVLHRIKAVRDFGNVKIGDVGGYIEKEENLSHEGDAWVCGNACVYDDAQVYGGAWVYGDARVCGNAWVYGDARVYGDAWVCGDAQVYGNTQVCGDAGVYDDAQVCGNACVYDDARVYGDAWVYGNAWVHGNAQVCGDSQVCGDALVRCNRDYFYDHGCGREQRTTTFFRTKDRKIGVRCGCFYGDMDEFRKKVKETHGDSKMAEEYLMLADFNEFRFGKGDKDEE